MTVFIGDVHGKYKQYERIIAGCQNSIQVGDMGVGFVRQDNYGGEGERRFYANPPHDKMKEGNHRFIRGNHDNPQECYKHGQYIGDGRVEPIKSIKANLGAGRKGTMFVGGGFSIDRAYRTEGYNWWPDEELSISELYDLKDQYGEVQPTVMVTHDCPQHVARVMIDTISGLSNGASKIDLGSRTRDAFEGMWHAHKPKLWVFGHWHHSLDKVIDGTRFVCLAELEVKEIDIDSLK